MPSSAPVCLVTPHPSFGYLLNSALALAGVAFVMLSDA
jgi:hypothetical protein